MLVPWVRKSPGAPLHARLQHGLWQIVRPRHERGEVELAYVRVGEDGRLPTIPISIASFASEAEAMFAVDYYESSPSIPKAADMLAAAGYAGEGSAVLLRLDPTARATIAVRPKTVFLEIEEANTRTCIACFNRAQSGEFTLFARPPGIEDPEALDCAILFELLDFRRKRGTRPFSAPLKSYQTTNSD